MVNFHTDTPALKTSLYSVAEEFEKTFKPGFFLRFISYFTKEEHPDLIRARNIKRVVTELKNNKMLLTDQFKVVLLIISAVYNSNSKLKKSMMERTGNTLGFIDEACRPALALSTNPRLLFNELFKPRTYGELLKNIANKVLMNRDTLAANRLLTARPSEDISKGPFTFVAIARIHKNSLPAKLPTDILKLIYPLTKTTLAAVLLESISESHEKDVSQK